MIQVFSYVPQELLFAGSRCNGNRSSKSRHAKSRERGAGRATPARASIPQRPGKHRVLESLGLRSMSSTAAWREAKRSGMEVPAAGIDSRKTCTVAEVAGRNVMPRARRDSYKYGREVAEEWRQHVAGTYRNVSQRTRDRASRALTAA